VPVGAPPLYLVVRRRSCGAQSKKADAQVASFFVLEGDER
jgi:hypothetical protein